MGIHRGIYMLYISLEGSKILFGTLDNNSNYYIKQMEHLTNFKKQWTSIINVSLKTCNDTILDRNTVILR
jgi:hypothetical protein